MSMRKNTENTEALEKIQESVFEVFFGIDFEKGQKNWRWGLTGHTVRPYKSCGKVSVVGCDQTHNHSNDRGKGTYMLGNCKRLGCPKCYEGTASQRSMVVMQRFAMQQMSRQEIEEKTAKIQKKYNSESKRSQRDEIIDFYEKLLAKRPNRIKHFVASPPQELEQWINQAWLTHTGYTQERKAAYKIALKCGCKGGVLIPHPYRLKCRECEHHPIPDHYGECPTCGSGNFEWYFSPHFHIIGYGWITGTEENYEQNGWVFKNLGVRKNVFATMQYLLSHAGVSRGALTINWFGSFSRQAIGKNPKTVKYNQVCDECQTPYVLLQPAIGVHLPKKIKQKRRLPFQFEAGEFTHYHSVG